MPSTPTTRNRLEKQAAGENSNTWGAPKLNTVIDLVDASLDGLTTKALTGNYSLTSTNYAADESRNRVLRFTGTGTFTVTIPGVEKWYIVDNQCTGDLTITTGSGATGVVQPGVMTVVTCDGTNVKALPPQSMVSSTALNVGTSTANDVQFVTNNATRYRIGSTGLHYFNGSTASGQVNIRAASGAQAIVLDNPSGTETLSFTPRLSAGFATAYAANATFSVGTTTANTFQFVTNSVIRYTISDAGIHQINGAGNTGVFNVRATSGSAAIVLDTGAGSERLHFLPRSTAGVSYINSQNSALIVGTADAYDLHFYTAGTYRGGISADGLTVLFTGVANSTSGAAANVYVDPATGRLYRSTSSARYKNEIATYVPGGSIDDLRAVSYRSNLQEDGPVYAGLIAEEVHAAGFSEFVEYDAGGRPDAIHYAHMVSLLIHEVQGLRRRVAALEAA